MSIQVFTDYACPFCYVAYMICRKIAAEEKVTFEPVFMEIHSDMPPQGADSMYLFSETRRMKMNAQLAELGRPYGIKPMIGSRLSSSKKAIIIRGYLQANAKTAVQDYDAQIYHLYLEEGKDIGDEHILTEVLTSLGINVPVSEMLMDPEALDKYKRDRMAADFEFIRKTPSFKAGKKLYKGILSEDELRKISKSLL